MSQRARLAVIYGVLSILILGFALGLTIGGNERAWLAWGAFSQLQVMFAALAMGYSSGRADERNKAVSPKDYY